jgi:hypothetical protein
MYLQERLLSPGSMFIYQLASSLCSCRDDIQVIAFANSPSVLANFPLVSNHLIASSIFPCCRQSWARVATATSQSGSIARASLHSLSAAGISCFHWKIARALLTSGRTFRGFLNISSGRDRVHRSLPGFI